MAFDGIPTAALDFYEDLEADNSKAFWQAHKDAYDQTVKAPILALAEELAGEFGTPKFFRPYRDVRFSKDYLGRGTGRVDVRPSCEVPRTLRPGGRVVRAVIGGTPRCVLGRQPCRPDAPTTSGAWF